MTTKIYLTALVLLLSGNAFMLRAQTGKGTWAFSLHNFSPVFGASYLAPTTSSTLAFSTGNSDSKTTTFGLNGNAQYFLFDNFSGTIQLNYLTQSRKSKNSDNKYTSTLILAGPELRDYFPVGKKASIWLKGGVAFGKYQSRFNGKKSGNPDKILRYGAGMGVIVFLTPHVSIDFGVDYSVLTTKNRYTASNGSEVENKGTMKGAALDIGFTVFL